MVTPKKPRGRRRIEPRLGEPKSSAGLHVTEQDRVAPTTMRRTKANKPRKSAKRPKKAQRHWLLRLIRFIIYWCAVVGIWGGIAAACILGFYAMRMPSADTWAVPDRPPNVKILSTDGKLIANRGITGGEAMSLHTMSPYLPRAVVAIEDRRFYSHFGMDPIGFTRAMVANVQAKRFVQGGSTLTQQLAKNLFLAPDRTIERKVQEVLLSFWLEHKYSKDQILEMYLNRVYFGSGAYGAEAASRRYFKKSARDLNLREAATLAGLLKAPSRLSPARNPQLAEERSQIVLAAMLDTGVIENSEMTRALSAQTIESEAFWTGSEHYAADRIMADIKALIGDITEDVIVDSTLDMTLQAHAEAVIRKEIIQNQKAKNVSQGAFVAIDHSGGVVAMVGGYSYAASQFDRATEAKRQPGSTFKPFVYLAALERGMTPQSMRNDAPVKIGAWRPENYGGHYYGQVDLTTALAKSLNSVAAQLAQEVGAKSIVEVAQRLGIRSPLQANASLALGTSEVNLLELTSAYVPFANGGYRAPAHFIKRITTTKGQVLYEHKDSGHARVIRDDMMGMMNHMMAQTLLEGTAKKAQLSFPAAGKTGTSQKSRDAWFVGYTGHLTAGVWFGNDDGTPMDKVTGGALPAEAWKSFMLPAHKGKAEAALAGYWIPKRSEPAADATLVGVIDDDGVIQPITQAQSDPLKTAGTPQKRVTIMDLLLGN